MEGNTLKRTEESITNLSNRHHQSPWVYVMDTRFSRETCQTGPGVCFRNGDGDILAYGNNGSVEDVFHTSSTNNSNPDIGVIAFQKENDQLRITFSRSLEEDELIIDEDTFLSEDVATSFGVKSIMIPQGNYSLNYNNFEHGETTISIVTEEVQLDYNDEYGQINKLDLPVRREATLESFLEYSKISKDDILDFKIIEFNYSGKGNAEHLVDGQIVNVWHNYENEPSVLFEITLENGNQINALRINACGNMLGWEARLLSHLLANHWFYRDRDILCYC